MLNTFVAFTLEQKPQHSDADQVTNTSYRPQLLLPQYKDVLTVSQVDTQ